MEPEPLSQEALNSISKKFQREISSGTFALTVLALVEQAREPIYGYQVVKQLETYVAPGTVVKQGTLYPVLRSLERQGLLSSQVEPSVSGPPRRYYTITSAGQAALKQWTLLWQQTRDFIDFVLQPGEKNDRSANDQ